MGQQGTTEERRNHRNLGSEKSGGKGKTVKGCGENITKSEYYKWYYVKEYMQVYIVIFWIHWERTAIKRS